MCKIELDSRIDADPGIQAEGFALKIPGKCQHPYVPDKYERRDFHTFYYYQDREYESQVFDRLMKCTNCGQFAPESYLRRS